MTRSVAAVANPEKFQMRVSPEFLALIDEWRRTQRDLPPRAEAIRRLVAMGTDHRSAQSALAHALQTLTKIAQSTSLPEADAVELADTMLRVKDTLRRMSATVIHDGAALSSDDAQGEQ
jgi:hypothetical protein